ncbi:hypothetical protein QTP88_009470 [Uroleucon formosanum]
MQKNYATTEDGVDNFDEIEYDSVTCVDDGINNSNIDIMEITATSSSEKSTSKRKKSNVEHALIDFTESHKASKKTSDNDEDLAFFYSLLPSMKSLTMDKKFEFRMQTMQLLQNLRTPEHSQFYNTSSSSFNKTPTNFGPPSSSSALSYYSQFSSDELSNEYNMENVNIENKVVASVSDNAANTVKEINDMDKFNLLRCTDHSIQLSVNAGLKNYVTKELINKIRKIVGYFNRSSSAQSELEKEQVKYGEPQNKLVQDCVTRWNSTCHMIESVIKHRYLINSVISKNKKIDEWFITSAEVQNLKDLVNVLGPFNILQDLKIRREMSPVLSKADALDPRFHELKFISDKQKNLIWEELETEICEMNPQSKEIRNNQNKAN